MCWGDEAPKPSQNGGSASPPGCAVNGCPLADIVVDVHQNAAAGPALGGLKVDIAGPESRSGTTDASGKVTFSKVKPGAYSVKTRKDEHSPDPVTGNVTAPSGGKVESHLVLLEDKVVSIHAKLPGTHGVRKPATDTRPDNVLTPSSSADMSLATNKPVILVRGCKVVELEAITVPPGRPVRWEVKANENSDAPPTLTPTDGGKKAKLKTNVHGSMSVIAKLGSTTVVWNVVFVWVKVDVKGAPPPTKRDAVYVDNGGAAGWCQFTAGHDSPGQYTWEASVKVKVVGGGTSKRLGTDKVKLHVLQNGVADTLTGHYAPAPPGPAGLAEEVPTGGLPIVDANGAGSPWGDHPGKFTPDNVSFEREVWTADPPAGSFPTTHLRTGQALQSISGVNGFKSSIASVSDDAPNAIQVHAETKWTADFSGTVSPAGVYTPVGAKTTIDAPYSLISEATGGQDAADANYETFEPRFNAGTTTRWTPP